MIFPKTIDEMHAEDENLQIEDNILPKVNPMDDDIIHLEIHNKGADTPAKYAHIEAHKAMMLFKKENPQMFPQPGAAPMLDFKPVTQPSESARPTSSVGARTKVTPNEESTA